jgi:D-arabinose 1-dehydrogenase-like Zn-dependent alcohol dehydrogenase
VTHGAGPGKHIGIAGIGGLGHIGIKLAKAMGCEVTAICTVQHQDTHSISELGTDHVLHSKDKVRLICTAANNTSKL